MLEAVYRQAYNSALSMAKMTEQAYWAERIDQNPLLDRNYWDAGNSGLLAATDNKTQLLYPPGLTVLHFFQIRRTQNS